MSDQEERSEENPHAIGKGIAFGLLFSLFIWAVILSVIWLWLR
jgi:hypothetical protein